MEYDFRTKITSLLAVLAVVFCATFALAQGIVTGSISGTVEDPSGAVVTGAKITAKHLATNREFTSATTSTGNFALRSLPPGAYDVKIEAPHYRSFESKGVGVTVGSDVSLGAVKMELGAASETVTVEGTAPIIESTTQQITNTFDSRKAEDLPVGNTLDSLALFAPGVATAGDASFSNNNGAEIAVNGQRARSNNYQIDGQNNNDNSVGGPSIFFGNQDAIGELQVVTNYSAEYGRNMGAVVNYVTKSGTNQFHGTGYEFYTGSHFDSLGNSSKSPLLGFCTPGQDPTATGCTPVTVPKFVENRFGGTVGGPIKKDKIWFFGSTNFDRQRLNSVPDNTGSQVDPTPAGISQLQAAFPNNPAVATVAAMSPAAVKGGQLSFSNLQNISVSATPGAVCPTDPSCVPVQFGAATRSVAGPFNDYEGTGRVDVKVTSKDNVFGRYIFQQSHQDGVVVNGFALGDWVTVPARDQQIGLDWVRNFSSNFINQGRFSFSRAGFGFEGGSFPNCTRASISNCPTAISFGDGITGGPWGQATNIPQGRIINVYQVQDNASWQVGKMTLKIGGEYDKQRSPNVFLPNVNGSYTYADFNSFLAGTPDSASIVSGNPHLNFKENDLAFYVQDDWRVKDNLTLNLGLRWEWFGQAINLLHDLTVKQQTGTNPFWDPTLPLSRTTVPYVPQDLNNFSPVVGFAWTPRMFRKAFGEDKTVIRGGFRIGYDPSFYNMFLNTATASPVVNAATIVGPPGVPAGGSAAAVQASLLPLALTGTDPGKRTQVQVGSRFHNPYTEQWNFGIQRSIGQRIAAEVRYVGNHDVGNFQNTNGNPALNPLIDAGFGNLIPAGLTPCSDPTQPGFGLGYVDCTRTRVLVRKNSAYSIYHSMQSELRMANWHGLTATASYTFSKVIDNASEVYSTIAGGNTVSYAQSPFNTSGGRERGVSGIDFPHLLGVTFIYDLPFYKDQHGFVGKVLGGWQMNTTYRYTTGQPYTTIESRFAGNYGLGDGLPLCDPGRVFSSFYDACRPILSNKSAPLNSIGICDPAVTSGCSLLGYNDLLNGITTPTTANAVHWIVNDNTAAGIFGSPYLGATRNINRGQPISTANLSMFKNTKLNERLTLQFRATAYNVMNTQFRGVPDPLLDDVFSAVPGGAPGSFQNTFYNPNGGATFAGNINTDGIGIRRLEFGAKLIF